MLYPTFGKARYAERSGVADFAFSSNGQLLAYTAQSDSLRELVIVNIATWQEHPVKLAGDVTRYAWSDGGVLAVAFDDTSQSYLGGLDVSSIDWSANESAPFAPVLTKIDDRLTWIGTDTLAFSRTTSTGSSVYLTRRASTNGGFSTPEATGPSYFNPTFQPTQEGLFVSDWRPASVLAPAADNVRIDFLSPAENPNANPRMVSHHPDEIVAPSGLITGRGLASAFDVFGASQDTRSQTPEPALRVANCKQFLAWTEAADRIACVNDSAVPRESGELRLFSIGAPGDAGTVVSGAGNYSVVASNAARRAFSPSGNWFAYSTEAGVFVADVRGDPPTPVRAISGTNDVVDLEFSPDDRVLLVNVGEHSSVLAFSLEEPRVTPAFLKRALPSRCVEEFARAPHQWCGRIRSTAGFAWSPTATIVAYRDTPESFVLTDLSRFDGGDFDNRLSAKSSSFAFQPARR